MFLETSRGKYVGFILTLGVNDLLRSLEVVRGHQRSKFKIVKTLFEKSYIELDLLKKIDIPLTHLDGELFRLITKKLDKAIVKEKLLNMSSAYIVDPLRKAKLLKEIIDYSKKHGFLDKFMKNHPEIFPKLQKITGKAIENLKEEHGYADSYYKLKIKKQISDYQEDLLEKKDIIIQVCYNSPDLSNNPWCTNKELVAELMKDYVNNHGDS